MTGPTQDPAVLSWQIALAPRPAPPPRRHWWRDLVTQSWRAAYDAWLADLEQASNGWATEAAEWKATHPAPRLSEFMVHLSSGAYSPGEKLPGWVDPARSEGVGVA